MASPEKLIEFFYCPYVCELSMFIDEALASIESFFEA